MIQRIDLGEFRSYVGAAEDDRDRRVRLFDLVCLCNHLLENPTTRRPKLGLVEQWPAAQGWLAGNVARRGLPPDVSLERVDHCISSFHVSPRLLGDVWFAAIEVLDLDLRDQTIGILHDGYVLLSRGGHQAGGLSAHVRREPEKRALWVDNSGLLPLSPGGHEEWKVARPDRLLAWLRDLECRFTGADGGLAEEALRAGLQRFVDKTLALNHIDSEVLRA